MPSTHTGLYYHLIFATKNREPVISVEWRVRLHEYLGGTICGLEGVPGAIGGTADHVHILLALKPTHCLADFLRDLKKASSAWATAASREHFHWQEGYAAFTVSPSARAAVQRYIESQEEHHRHQSFREELIEFLQKSGVEYDERYLD